MLKMTFVAIMLGLLASKLARLVGGGSLLAYVGFTAAALVVLLLLMWREWRRRRPRRSTGNEQIVLRPGHPNYIIPRPRSNGGDGDEG